MQVSSTINNYQSLQAQQKPVTLPVEIQPQEPTYSNKEIYEASQGNVIRGEDGKLTLTPQGETNVANAKEDVKTDLAENVQEKKDAQRGVVVDYLDASSKKSQVEIYLAVATDGKASEDNAAIDVIRELRDVQKQNNTIQAYAAYQEAQKNGIPALF